MSSTLLLFRDFQLDPGQFRLRRSGYRIRLERKPLELLILLAEKQGRLVSREEIVERIWGKGVFFDAERGVNNAVRKIRSALNDDAERPQFVETVLGKGYRFVAPIETETAVLAAAGGAGGAPRALAVAASLEAAQVRRSWRRALAGAVGLAFLSILTFVLQRQPVSAVPKAALRHASPEAYEAYVRGRYLFDRREQEAARKSVEYFRQAITEDPSFAPAYVGLAEALPASQWFAHQPPIDVMDEAKAAAKRALQLDNTLGEAHTAMGSLLQLYDWNWGEAEKELKRGLVLGPNNSLAHERYAMWLQSQGRVDDAVQECQQAQALDPASFFMNRDLGGAYYWARRYNYALVQLQRAEELGPPNRAAVTLWMRQSYEGLGRRSDAIDLALREAAEGQTTSPLMEGEAAVLQRAYSASGWTGYWTKWIELHSSRTRPTTEPYFLALAEARLGHAEKAWSWMQNSADRREVWITWVKVDPLLDNVRSSPEYPWLLKRLHLAP